jgi:hypothetical protein
MALRSFQDADGVEWQVWDTIPAKLVSTTYEGGWLTFQSAAEKRRLAPIPLYWMNADVEELSRLLRKAKPVAELLGPRTAEDEGPSLRP